MCSAARLLPAIPTHGRNGSGITSSQVWAILGIVAPSATTGGLGLISENQQKPTHCPEHVCRAQRLFSMIAPVYDPMLARSMTRVYRKAVDLLLHTNLHVSEPGHAPSTLRVLSTLQPPPTEPIPPTPALSGLPLLCRQLHSPCPAPTALDVGTGTGLLASELAKAGFQVTAIDSCSAMLRVARLHRPRAASYIQAEAHLASRQPGAPFDIVCAGMLLRGLPRGYRREVLADMVRAARHAVMAVDYFPPGNLITAAVERLEGSYYRDFLHEFRDDLTCIAANTLVHPLTATCALYVLPLSHRPQNH